MQIIRKHSSTSNIIRFKLRSSTTGQGVTGLSSASSGLIISTICDNEETATAYTVAGSTIETITTLATYAAPTATKCRFREVDATNHRGLYEFQFADARFAVASAKMLRIDVTGAAGMLDRDCLVQFEQVPADATHAGGIAWGSGAITAAAIAASAFSMAKFAADIGTTAYASNPLAQAIWERLLTAMTTVGSAGKKLADEFTQTGDSFARIGAAGAGLTAADDATITAIAALNNISAAQVTAAVPTAAQNAAAVDVALINTGDGADLLQAIANQIAADWVAGDASPLAIIAAMKADATIAQMIARIDAATTTRASQTSVDTIDDLLDTEMPALTVAIAAEAVKTAAIKVKTDQMVFTTANRVDASATVSIAAADIRAAIGMAAADLDTQLDAILAAASAGAGSGARTVTITVNDGTTVLENAIVRMTEGVNSFRALTNVSGVAVFNLDDATYTVSITKSGYSYSGTTIVVNGTETATYSMTAITITPGAGDLTTGWLVTRVAGVATEDITIRYQQRQEPASDTGSSYDDTIYSVESDEDGLVELSMVRGAYYYVWRGTGKRPELAQLLLIPANAGATYELPSHVGH